MYKCIVAVLTGFFLLLGLCSFAQGKGSISGTVSDSTFQKTLQYVTVELYKQNQPTEALKSSYTNDKGKFSFTGIDSGSYTLVFSHTGFAEKQVFVTVLANGAAEVPPVMLSAATGTALGGVTVKAARKPLVEMADDKVVFNVENDPASKTSTAIDILRKTPFVSVDGDNNVTVNGQSNFKVLLNGRETAMFAQNVKEALKGFPGAVITKIEVITSPSARYDAEGVGGIINIITKKKVMGYNGSANIWYLNTGWYNVNANLSAKYGKFGLTVNYGAGGADNVKGTSRMETVPLVAAPFTRRTLYGNRNMTNFWNFGNAELSYELDSLNTVALYGNVSGGNNHNSLNQSITTSYKASPDSISYYNLDSRNEYPTKSIGADYIRKFSSNKDKEFSIRWNGEFGTSNTFLNSIMDNPETADRYVINNSIAKNTQYTFQSDYVLPLKGNQKLETGVKAIIRKASSDFEGKIKTNSIDDYKANPSNTDGFRYDQNVYSAYSSYNFKTGKTSFRLGARVEHTETDGNFISSKTNVQQQYTNLLPNLQASVKFSNAFSMVVTYSDRIQRPFIQNLNPFRNDNDPRYIVYGNPNLQPQTIHSLAVQTRLSKGATFAGITLTGSYSNNMIVQYASFNSATGVTSTTSDNVGKETAVMANGNFNTKINKDWSVFLGGNVRYNKVENKYLSGQSRSGISGNANLNTSYSVSKKFVASAYTGFFQAPVTIQTKYPLNIWYGVDMGYKFLHEKLTVSLGLTNFLQKMRDYKLTTYDPAFQYTSVVRNPFRGISLSLSWNFGKLTESVSKKKGVSNDDKLTTSN
jgi:outer membrane receptor protein involved in Fe transport